VAVTPTRLFDLVRECQRFAGESSLTTSRTGQASLVRDFVSRLPNPDNAGENLLFRGVLLELVLGWATRIHSQFHATSPAACSFAAVEEMWPYWVNRACCSKAAFKESASAFLTRLDATHPLSPAAKARDIIDLRYDESLRVETLARMSGCHPVRLRALFRREFGLSMREYRTNVRVHRASSLVTRGDVKIEAVAAMVGFRSRRNFYNAFRRVTGRTPSEVRVRRTSNAVPSD
jgi:AraC-like DNA-binding protein